MAEDVTTQEVIEETPEVTTEETQEKAEEGTSTEQLPTEITVDDIVSGKKPAEDRTPVWAKKRFDELTAKIYEKERRIKELEESKAIPSTIPSVRPVLPIESDFIEPEDYRKARIEYEDKLDVWKGSQRQNAEFQERQEQEFTENLSKFNERATKMREKYPDFDTAINEPVFTPVMSNEVMASEYGPEIGYFLSKNPAEALRLSKLSPTGIAKEIGKLEVKFSQATKRISSNAPEPLKPLKGDDTPVKDPSKMTDDEWFKWEQQQKLKKLKLGG